MRVTQSSITQSALVNISRAYDAMRASQTQASTMKRFSRPSDDPAAATSVFALRGEQRANTQWKRNAESATDLLGVVDKTVSSVHDAVMQAQSLLQQASNAALPAAARTSIASELTLVREQLLALSNTVVSGRPLFAGTAAGAYDAFGNYVGNNAVSKRTIGDNTNVDVSFPGPTVFGTANAGTPLSGDLFQILTAAATAVAAGDQPTINAAQNVLETARSRVSAAQGEAGTRTRFVESIIERLDDQALSLTSQRSKLEDVDIVEVTTLLATRRASYEAALSATAKLIAPTLADFLR